MYSGNLTLAGASFTREGDWPSKEADEFISKVQADYGPYTFRAQPVYTYPESDHIASMMYSGNPEIPPAKRP